jgi:hypothetical protein
MKRVSKRMIMLSLLAMLTLFYLTGCAMFSRKILILDAEKTVTRVKSGESLTPSFNGYFVPDARMKEILDALSKKVVFGTQTNL